MEDIQIIDLFWQRSEQAISETETKYGAYCYQIAHNILNSHEDATECVNDTYLAAWNTIPPQRPGKLSAWLGKITRYISLDRWKMYNRTKRGGGEMVLCLEELADCVSGQESTESAVLRKELVGALNRFLLTLPETERKVFLSRYWYAESIEKIGDRFGYTSSKTASMLFRTRKKLNRYLEQEGLK